MAAVVDVTAGVAAEASTAAQVVTARLAVAAEIDADDDDAAADAIAVTAAADADGACVTLTFVFVCDAVLDNRLPSLLGRMDCILFSTLYELDTETVATDPPHPRAFPLPLLCELDDKEAEGNDELELVELPAVEMAGLVDVKFELLELEG